MQKIFVLFELLLPFGQWTYGESRVQKSRVPPVSAPPRTKSEIHKIRVRIKEEIRVCLERQREIRVQE